MARACSTRAAGGGKVLVVAQRFIDQRVQSWRIVERRPPAVRDWSNPMPRP
jgi:hypothetical protein